MSSAREMSGERAATYFAYFPDGSPPTPTESDAYVHVRVTEPVQASGSVTVYLPNGTALLVPCRDLVRLAPARCELPHPMDLAQNAGRIFEAVAASTAVAR
jgi:hypothetical protein